MISSTIRNAYRLVSTKPPFKVRFSKYSRPVLASEMVQPKIINISDKIEFQELFTPELNKLRNLFESNNYEIRMAGGAVRDLLMGIKPSDVDFASTATPDEMKELFTKENIRMLHMRGEEHGTITCRIDEKENFEITTLRVDVLCDGRRAEVQYTTNWQLDANRRDLTINSLFLDMEGNVIDYFDGIEDCKGRRVSFVGDAAQRIQEDYLRILRYFRFYGRIANLVNEHSVYTLDAIKKYKDGLKNVSGERIWTEFRKILVGRFAGPVIRSMLDECGLHEHLGLQPSVQVAEFIVIDDYCSQRERCAKPATMLAALLPDLSALARFHQRAKISNAEKNLAEYIVVERQEAKKNKFSTEYFKKMLVDRERGPNIDRKNVSGRECITELMKYVCVGDEVFNAISDFESPEFPVRGTDLMNIGAPKGKAMRELLQKVYDYWKETNFTLTQEELLNHAKEIILAMGNVNESHQRVDSTKNRKRKSPVN